MSEVTPGALGRLMHDDPEAVAHALFEWCGDADEAAIVAAWFEQMAGALAALAVSPNDGSRA